MTDDEAQRHQLEVRWYARPNDMIGGWCVMDCDMPLSEAFDLRARHGGAFPEIAVFASRIHAEYIAGLHNERLNAIDGVRGSGVTAQCPVCSRVTALTRHGKLHTHRSPAQYPGQLHRPSCPASGKTPQRAAADEVTAMGQELDLPEGRMTDDPDMGLTAFAYTPDDRMPQPSELTRRFAEALDALPPTVVDPDGH
jgi:hypothetical protein